YHALGIPAEKLVMAAPLYGYRWPTVSGEPGAATRGPGVAIPLTAPAEVLPELPRATVEAALHGVRRDPESGVPYYAFQDDRGLWFQGWYDDAESLGEKLRFVRDRGLGGLALFPLVYGAPSVWDVVREFRPGR
ncbi:MAG TPA: glycosyl hydrolase family 18 protein, partial [Longimicrobiales bacterium]|nr:glycosyl hydrolase family 18 protein [Longimicrobiales bacterium]